MDVAQLLVDGFGRVREEVHGVLDGLDEGALAHRPPRADGTSGNSVAWLVWHLTRVQDDHVADAFDSQQVWLDGWAERAGLPLPPEDTGYGHGSDDVEAVVLGADVLRGYHDAVHDRTVGLVGSLAPRDLDRVVDRSWDPPVTLGVRLVSVLSDDLQHVGQAAYLRGLMLR
ncbi:mycothiol transferase [Cellulomonas carbonis]|uniref:Chorismate synthase n=1 Tax=Cellulomonas carbonis T26 TaxID=947969 RepID=A0A0A0BNF1_9CELL|nr:DUF664 domain-containing protein [Cellulomonas carbonis]KGM10028.1 chorismate synthase [Cellulomonas carbonis T26]GGC17496.1 hypothetical protein GCM10010972_33480 [Cellulomonas carbonis]